MLLLFDHIARYIVKELQRHVNGCDASRSRLHWRQHSLTIPQPTEWQHIGNQIDAAIIFVRAQTWCSDFVEASILSVRGYRENSDGEIVKNILKPSGEFNVCMGGDDGRYGWVGITKGPSPAVIAISLRGLSSIKHAQESLMTSGARNHLPSGNQKRF